MYLGQEFHVLGDWFIIHFTENNGMAFGWEFAGDWGKLVLTSFRILAVAAIWYWLYNTVKTNGPKGLSICIALIFAGAVGNIIDSVFYGKLFSSSDFELAHFLPAEGAYASWMHGRVVDMLYFPLMHGHFPMWFPIWAGEEFIFFRPVFNIADSAITVGVFAIILFQKKYFTEHAASSTMADISQEETSATPAE